MNTSSYLEAFLSVYGWMMYNVLYELFAMLWLIFLPFMRLAYTTFIDTVADANNRAAELKRSIIAFIAMLFAMFLALVPMDSMKIKDSTVNSVCIPAGSKINIDSNELIETFKFNINESGKVPLLPSLVMRLASGTNNVIYNAIPCTVSVNNFAGVIQTAEITNPELQKEVERFEQECIVPAETRLQRLEREAPKSYAKMLENFKKTDSKNGDGKLSSYTLVKERRHINSSLYKLMMEPDMGKAIVADPGEQKAVEEIMNSGTGKGDPLRTYDRVTGVTSDDPDASRKQKADSSAPVKCIDWWEKKLYPELKKMAEGDIALRVARDGYFAAQCYDTDMTGNLSATYNEGSCKAAVLNAVDDANFHDEVVYRMLSYQNKSGLGLSREDKQKAGGLGALGVIGSILSFFTGKSDVLGSIASNASGFYAQMFFYRVLIQLLQPMLLMGIFCFWAIYIILSAYRWETIFKGLVLIYVVSIMPGLWAITQHLDGTLWAAMYPDGQGLSSGARSQLESPIERLLLDAASTVFNVIFPLLLMYVVMEAGVGNPTAGIRATSQGADQIGRNAGSNVGIGASGVSHGLRGLQNRLSGNKSARPGKDNLPPGGSR